MPAAVFALEPGAGLADEAVARGPARIVSAAIAVIVIGIGVAAERGRRNRARGADRAAYDAGCDISRPEAGVPAIVVPGVMPAVVPIRLIVPSAPFAAIGRGVAVGAGGSSVGIPGSQVRTIGIREFGLASAWIRDDCLRHRWAHQHRGKDGGSAEKSLIRHAVSPWLRSGLSAGGGRRS